MRWTHERPLNSPVRHAREHLYLSRASEIQASLRILARSSHIPLLGGRKAEAVLADKGYDTDAMVQHIESSGAEPVIPPKANRKVQRSYNKALYKQRNQIERCFSKLKHLRRFATRFEKNKVNFQAVVALACSVLLLA